MRVGLLLGWWSGVGLWYTVDALDGVCMIGGGVVVWW